MSVGKGNNVILRLYSLNNFRTFDKEWNTERIQDSQPSSTINA